jgi:hypothetical protein
MGAFSVQFFALFKHKGHFFQGSGPGQGRTPVEVCVPGQTGIQALQRSGKIKNKTRVTHEQPVPRIQHHAAARGNHAVRFGGGGEGLGFPGPEPFPTFTQNDLLHTEPGMLLYQDIRIAQNNAEPPRQESADGAFSATARSDEKDRRQRTGRQGVVLRHGKKFPFYRVYQ